MSTYNWKSHPFEKLHETGNPALPATLSSFIVWKDGVVHSTGAVCAKHIIGLIKWAMFNQAVVALALLYGKRFGAIDINTERGFFNAVDVLKMDLASFGIQIKKAAQMHHSECFVGNGPLITKHPLRKLQAEIQKDLQLTVRVIDAHMQEISVLCTQSIIIAQETEQNAVRSLDSKIMPTLIGKLQMAEGDKNLAE
eukprot:396776-Rhodomonas_salina.1